MTQETSETPLATLPMPASAKRVGLHYETFRKLVRAGVFTKVVRSVASKRPHVNLLVVELDAFHRGGVDAVRRVQQDRADQVATAVEA